MAGLTVTKSPSISGTAVEDDLNKIILIRRDGQWYLSVEGKVNLKDTDGTHVDKIERVNRRQAEAAAPILNAISTLSGRALAVFTNHVSKM